jgi:hypothetical protein
VEQQTYESPFDACELFAGYVPAYCLLGVHLDGIGRLLSYRRKHGESELLELAYIGVVAYAESFFKDHFASILNIYPHGIAALRRNGCDVSVDLSDVVELDEPIHARCGFLLAEKLNFGAPKSINALYQQLLTVTPFSKDDAKEFDEVLARRNLLVHHGGIYTSRFLRSTPSTAERKFADSFSVCRFVVFNIAALVNEIAFKTLTVSKARLTDELGANASRIQLEGLRMLDWDNENGSARTSNLRSAATRWLEIEQNSEQSDLTDGDIPF